MFNQVIVEVISVCLSSKERVAKLDLVLCWLHDVQWVLTRQADQLSFYYFERFVRPEALAKERLMHFKVIRLI